MVISFGLVLVLSLRNASATSKVISLYQFTGLTPVLFIFTGHTRVWFIMTGNTKVLFTFT